MPAARTTGPAGRSPRVRGSPAVIQLALAPGGSIPAGAGKPARKIRRRSLGWVDPRGCGEATVTYLGNRHAEGRSPRVRGSPDDIFPHQSATGSIPAGAGKPSTTRRRSGLIGVDPRGCGEAEALLEDCEDDEGRSPRVRGSRVQPTALRVVLGSIPAGAGKPSGNTACPCPGRVDPRGCGEARKEDPETFARMGRSPRVRGSHGHLPRQSPRRGSIPAGAGKPRRYIPPPVGNGVDPRGCGEAIYDEETVGADRGRSPRVRGSRGAAGRLRGRRGSIPAGAGKPRPAHSLESRFRVDPRGCGEAERIEQRIDDVAGRSPRVRGSPNLILSHNYSWGSIPAGAGKPHPDRSN